MPVLELTEKMLSEFRLTEGKTKLELCDTKIKGFIANVSATHLGEASLVFKYKDKGKTKRKPLGRFPQISVENAREIAKQLKEDNAAGVDISSLISAPGMTPKLSDFVTKTWLPNQRERIKPNTYKMYEGLARRHILPPLGNVAMDRIRKQDVLTLVTSLRQSGLSAATANRTLATLRACFNSAIDMQIVEVNPASKVKLYREPLKERYLNNVELSGLLRILATDENQNVCRAVRFALYTGARIGEILKARIQDINVDEAQWTIPTAHNKTGLARTTPLNTYAMGVISELDLEHPSGRLFIGRLGEPLTEVRKVWGRIRGQAGLPDLNLHSLRHQHASMLVNSGRTLYEVQKILGHTSSRTTERYSHLQANVLRDASNSISKTIDKALANRG